MLVRLSRRAICERIRKLRKSRKFSQAYVAQGLGISQAAYSFIESSQNGMVAEHIIKLSRLFDVTTDFILKGDKMLIRMSRENGFIPLQDQKLFEVEGESMVPHDFAAGYHHLSGAAEYKSPVTRLINFIGNK